MAGDNNVSEKKYLLTIYSKNGNIGIMSTIMELYQDLKPCCVSCLAIGTSLPRSHNSIV